MPTSERLETSTGEPAHVAAVAGERRARGLLERQGDRVTGRPPGCRRGRRRSSCRRRRAAARRAAGAGSRAGAARPRRTGSPRRTRARDGSRRPTRGRTPRTSSVCQRIVISSASLVSSSARSTRVSAGSSRCASSSAIRTCARRRVRLVASVGWAVSTSSSDTPPSRRRSVSPGTDASQPECLLERLARRLCLLGVLAPPAQAVVLLGGVRELEVERERAQHRPLALGRQRRAPPRARPPRRRARASGGRLPGSVPRRRGTPRPPARPAPGRAAIPATGRSRRSGP